MTLLNHVIRFSWSAVITLESLLVQWLMVHLNVGYNLLHQMATTTNRTEDFQQFFRKRD